MTKISSFQTIPILIGGFEVSPSLGYLAAFVSAFDIRVSDFFSQRFCGECFLTEKSGITVKKGLSHEPETRHHDRRHHEHRARGTPGN